MTARDSDVLQPKDHQCVRTAWLAGVLCTARKVDYPRYQARFFRTIRSYYRDLEMLAVAGIRYESEPNDHGNVILLGADF